MMLWWCLLACPRPISPELELAPPVAAVAPEPTTLPEWRAWVLHDDPLARRPRAPSTLLDPSLGTWFALAAGVEPSQLWAVEAEGGAGVPYARGARLAEAEVRAAVPSDLLPWLVPMSEPDGAPVESARGALDFLGKPSGDGVLAILERAVLESWAQRPIEESAAAAEQLQRGQWARLAALPAGRLLIARAQAPKDAAAAARAREALEHVTAMALHAAAADRADEHAALVPMRRALAERWPGDDPGSMALTTAFNEALADAGTAQSFELARIAQGALRWLDRCPDAPCTGYDRLAAFDTPDPTAAAFAAAWKIAVWKGAVDELQATWERPQAPRAMDRVVELLTHASPRSLERDLLLRPQTDVAWRLAVARAAGGVDGTSKEAVFFALNRRLARLCAELSPQLLGDHRAPALLIQRRAEAASAD